MPFSRRFSYVLLQSFRTPFTSAVTPKRRRSGAKPLHSAAKRRRRPSQPRPSEAGALFHNALTTSPVQRRASACCFVRADFLSPSADCHADRSASCNATEPSRNLNNLMGWPVRLGSRSEMGCFNSFVTNVTGRWPEARFVIWSVADQQRLEEKARVLAAQGAVRGSESLVPPDASVFKFPPSMAWVVL